MSLTIKTQMGQGTPVLSSQPEVSQLIEEQHMRIKLIEDRLRLLEDESQKIKNSENLHNEEQGDPRMVNPGSQYIKPKKKQVKIKAPSVLFDTQGEI